MPLTELLPGDPARLGAHRLLGRIGQGGMGTVYLGLAGDGQVVALKVLRDGGADPDARLRFGRELQALQRVRGPHLVELLHADLESDPAYLVTRFVPGERLDHLVQRGGPRGTGQALTLARGIAEALSTLHEAGVVHRDLTPGNVLVLDGDPHVIDLGLASALDLSAFTRTGLLVGTPSYLSPEQVRGTDVGPPADVHAWGATLAFACTGVPPFGTGRPDTVLYRIVHEQPALDGVPRELAWLVQAALDPDPMRRPGARTLLAALGGSTQAAPVTVQLPRDVDATTVLAHPQQLRRLAVDSPDRSDEDRTHVLASAEGRPADPPAAHPVTAHLPVTPVAAPATSAPVAGSYDGGTARLPPPVAPSPRPAATPLARPAATPLARTAEPPVARTAATPLARPAAAPGATMVQTRQLDQPHRAPPTHPPGGPAPRHPSGQLPAGRPPPPDSPPNPWQPAVPDRWQAPRSQYDRSQPERWEPDRWESEPALPAARRLQLVLTSLVALALLGAAALLAPVVTAAGALVGLVVLRAVGRSADRLGRRRARRGARSSDAARAVLGAPWHALAAALDTVLWLPLLLLAAALPAAAVAAAIGAGGRLQAAQSAAAVAVVVGAALALRRRAHRTSRRLLRDGLLAVTPGLASAAVVATLLAVAALLLAGAAQSQAASWWPAGSAPF